MLDSPEKTLSQEQKVQKEVEVNAKTAQEIEAEFANLQTIAEQIKNETDQFDKETIQNARDIPKEIKDRRNNRTDIERIDETVKKTLLAVKVDKQNDGTYVNDHNIFPAESKNTIRLLVLEIDVNDVNEQNAVYLYSIFNLGYTNRLQTADDIVRAFNSIKILEYIDVNLHNKIARGFQQCITSMPNLSEDERKNSIDSLKTESQKKIEASASVKTKEELKLLHDRSQRIMQEISDVLENLTDPNNPNNKAKLEGLIGDDKLQKTDPLQREDEKVNRLLDIRTKFNLGIQDLFRIDQNGKVNIPSDADLIRSIDSLKLQFKEYFDKHIIGRNEYELLYKRLQEYKEIAQIQLGELRKNEGRSLRILADNYSGVYWDVNEYELIDNLDTPEGLKKLAPRYNDFADPQDWKRFYKDIKGLFERLFEIPQSQPKQFWEQAFNPLHEGFFYKMLLQNLAGLGNKLKTDVYFSKKGVYVEDFFDELSEHDTATSSHDAGIMKLTGTKLIKRDIGSAIGSILHGQMIDLHDVREYLHNTSIISLMGMGWDKMAEYSARLNIKDIDLLFHTTENLSDAYNFYIQSLYQELAINGHMMWTNFGKKNADQLDPVEVRTYQQLAALKGVTTFGDKEINSLIKMAGDLSKGVFGEFWGAAMTSRFPLLTSVEYKVDEKTGKRKVDEHGKWVVSTKSLGPSYLSIHYPGLEKMLKDLDIDYQLQRFNHPRFWDMMRNAYAPRSNQFHNKDTLKEYHWAHHGDIYTYGKMDDDAFLQGRTPEMATFDSKYVMWKDRMRTSSVDLFLRGAWRFYQYEKYFVYKQEQDENGKSKTKLDPRNNKPILDFDETMKRMQGIGPYLVTTFIDDFFDYQGREQKYKDTKAGEGELGALGIEQLAVNVIEEFTNDPQYAHLFKKYNSKPRGDRKLDEKTELGPFRELLYKKYIFDRIANMRPTHYLAIETRRFTPQKESLLSWRLEDELKKMFSDYPNNFIKGEILPIYIGAIEMVENKIWKAKKQKWKEYMDAEKFPEKDPLDYKLELSDFDTPEMIQALIDYLDLAKSRVGAIPLKGEYLMLKDEQFRSHVKTLFTTLKKGIDDPDRRDDFEKGFNPKDPTSSLPLSARYASFMRSGLGNIKHYFKGNLFDFSEFSFQQAGSRSPEREKGEVGQVATKMTPALKTMIYDNIPELVKREYPDMHAFEKAVTEFLSKPFKEWYDAIAVIDPEQGMREAVYLVTFMAQVVGKDRRMRYKVFGDIFSDFSKRMWGTQGSLMTDHFMSVLRRPTTAPDSDGIETLVHTLLSSINMPLKPDKIIGYEKNALGIQVPKKDLGHWENQNMELVEEILGVTGKDRMIESAPIFPVIFLLIMAILAKLAMDKNKNKG